jgi:putative aminopeptidase FrvX
LFDDTVTVLNDRLYCGRALDNRLGGYIIAEVARRTRQILPGLPYSFCAVNTVQEEVGLRGAQMMAHRLRPSVAIAVDVVNDTNTPRVLKHEQGDVAIGRGPVLPTAPSVNPLLLQKLIAVAGDHDIEFQRTAMGHTTGTDADAFAYSGAGIATVLLCVPIKYMHTTVETAHKDDIAATIELLYHFLLALDLDELESEGLFGSAYSVPQPPERSMAEERASFQRDGHHP